MKVRRQAGSGQYALKKILESLDNKIGRVGWFKNDKYEDGTQVSQVAATQEFGNVDKKIPPRPFMRPTIEKKQNEWRALIQDGAKAIVQGNATSQQVMEAVTQKAAAEVRETISQLKTPPLSDATKAARLRKRADKKTVGSLTKPLVDSTILYTTLTSVVTNK